MAHSLASHAAFSSRRLKPAVWVLSAVGVLALIVIRRLYGINFVMGTGSLHGTSVRSRGRIPRRQVAEAKESQLSVTAPEELQVTKYPPQDELVRKFGMVMATPTSIEYSSGAPPAVSITFGLAMITPGSDAEVVSGTKSFAREFADTLGATPWCTVTEPQNPTAKTFMRTFISQKGPGYLGEAEPDDFLKQIGQGSWKGVDLIASGQKEDADLAAAYEAGSFTAKPSDGTGESRIDLMFRAAVWLENMQEQFEGKGVNVLAFVSRDFQNAVEVLVQAFPGKTPAEVFSCDPAVRVMSPGRVQVVAPMHIPIRSKSGPVRLFARDKKADEKRYKRGFDTNSIWNFGNV